LLGRRQAVATVGVPIPMPLVDGVHGMDLARDFRVAVRGLGESFANDDAFSRHAPSWMHRCKTPPPLDPQVLLGCWPVVEFPLCCCFGAKDVCWRGHGHDRSSTRLSQPSSSGASTSRFCCLLLFCSLVCALRGIL
jgi:hypothetical protein